MTPLEEYDTIKIAAGSNTDTAMRLLRFEKAADEAFRTVVDVAGIGKAAAMMHLVMEDIMDYCRLKIHRFSEK